MPLAFFPVSDNKTHGYKININGDTMRKILAFYTALALLFSIPALAAASQQNFTLELDKPHYQEIQKLPDAHQKQIDDIQRGSGETKLDDVLLRIKKVENQLTESIINKKTLNINISLIILAILSSILLIGFAFAWTKKVELDKELEKLKKTNEEQDKISSDLWVTGGNALRAMGEHEPRKHVKRSLLSDAIEKYKKAASLDEHNDKAFNNWGICQHRLAEIEEHTFEQRDLLKKARENFEKATRLKQGCSIALKNLGACLSDLAIHERDPAKKGRLLEDAEIASQKAYNHGSSDNADEYYSLLGRVRLQQSLLAEQQGQNNEATDLFEEARRRIAKVNKKKLRAGLVNLACLKLASGNDDGCQKILKKLEHSVHDPPECLWRRDPLLRDLARDKDWF